MFLDCKPQNIIVFGDIMLDYINTGTINKLANEAPIPVFLKENEMISLGGCGNVLQNLASLGCQNIVLFSMCGNDLKSKGIEQCLEDLGIESHMKKVENRKTTSKHRFFCSNKLIFRYDEEEYYNLDSLKEKEILDELKTVLQSTPIDCILFSDYNKGFLTETLCQGVIQMANEYNIFTCVDPKKDYLKYKNCSLIKPNRNEVEQMFGIHFALDSLPQVHTKIKELVNCKHTVITLGDQGISGCFENNDYFYWKYEPKDVIDVTGAGDVVNSVLAYCFPHFENKRKCLEMASFLATLSVQQLGTYKLQVRDILIAEKMLNQNKLVQVEDLKNMKRSILFTNGCFDILHEGHISLFKYCKSLAGSTHDVVLGLNSDESIKRLKGESRPIFNIKARLAILNALEYIDWIVVFDEDTPKSIIQQIKPDILVKGGDYTSETVVGKEYCRELKLYTFTETVSTTNIVKYIKEK